MQKRTGRKVVGIALLGIMKAGDVRKVVNHLKLMERPGVLTVAEGYGFREPAYSGEFLDYSSKTGSKQFERLIYIATVTEVFFKIFNNV